MRSRKTPWSPKDAINLSSVVFPTDKQPTPDGPGRVSRNSLPMIRSPPDRSRHAAKHFPAARNPSEAAERVCFNAPVHLIPLILIEFHGRVCAAASTAPQSDARRRFLRVDARRASRRDASEHSDIFLCNQADWIYANNADFRPYYRKKISYIHVFLARNDHLEITLKRTNGDDFCWRINSHHQWLPVSPSTDSTLLANKAQAAFGSERRRLSDPVQIES